MKAWPWIVGAAVLLSAGAAKASYPVGKGSQQGLADLRRLARAAGLDDGWTTFLAAVAHHESRWNNLAALGDPALMPPFAQPKNESKGEASAARAAYDNRVELHACGSPSAYQFGSGGWFGLLPAYGVRAFRGSAYQCIHPYKVFEQEASIVMALGFAKRLMGYDGFKTEPTWANLNRGWKAPSRMGAPVSGTDDRFYAALDALGVPRSFGLQRVTALPFDAAALYERLKASEA